MKLSPMTVTELNGYIKSVLDKDEMLNNVYIKGEISNFKNHYTGHMYFTLKDKTSLIKCVMFKTYAEKLKFVPNDGMSVIILGSVAVFERDGIYQIYAKGMEPDGMGALYTAFEQLKEKLEKEGLFDQKYKKSIPILPKSICVITSKTGAVIRDIINVTTRRFPKVNIKLFPAAVQGPGAANTIVKAIEKINELKLADVIIVARGGGSLEDLWPFNEEITARAIFKSEIPIISAVGHETDFTIADFVADLRAPTPSAAGELVVPEINEVRWKIKTLDRRMSLSLNKKVENMRNRYNNAINKRAFKDPFDKIRQYTLIIDTYTKQIHNKISILIKDAHIKLVKLATGLDAMSPLKTLIRGYSLIEDKNKNIIKSINDLKKDEKFRLILHDGSKMAEIIE
jgi:exodeoxyribonuclease VII large subunit